MNRKVHLDLLRLLATLAVVALHVSAQNINKVEVTSGAFYVFSVVNGMVRWSVPAFLMISGELFLGRGIPLRVLYQKYILRLVGILVVWSGVYAVVGLLGGAGAGETIASFITGHYHLWYLYMVVGIYAMLPILNRIIEDRTTEKYFLVLAGLFGILIPSVNALLALKVVVIHSWMDTILGYMQVPMAGGFVFFFVMGGFIVRREIAPRIRIMLYILATLSVMVSVGMTIYLSKEMNRLCIEFYEYNSIWVMCEAIGIFVACKEIQKRRLKTRTKERLAQLSDLCLGVYLIHPMLLELLQKNLGIDTLSFPASVAMVVITVTVVILSFVISFVLTHIPVVKKFCS